MRGNRVRFEEKDECDVKRKEKVFWRNRRERFRKIDEKRKTNI